jgi:hypothetical protein
LEWLLRPPAARLPATPLSITRTASGRAQRRPLGDHQRSRQHLQQDECARLQQRGGAVTPGGLLTAQDARVANNIRAITKPNIYAPSGGDTPPAVANAYKGDLADAFNFATNEATNAGKLGAYGDQLFNSNLAEQSAMRQIGVGNSNADNPKSLLPAQQDIAQTEAYKPPTPWGQILSGGMLGSYSGPNASTMAPSCPSGPAACSRRRRLQCSGRTAGADLSAAGAPRQRGRTVNRDLLPRHVSPISPARGGGEGT